MTVDMIVTNCIKNGHSIFPLVSDKDRNMPGLNRWEIQNDI